jgi:hypothetical protein
MELLSQQWLGLEATRFWAGSGWEEEEAAAGSFPTAETGGGGSQDTPGLAEGLPWPSCQVWGRGEPGLSLGACGWSRCFGSRWDLLCREQKGEEGLGSPGLCSPASDMSQKSRFCGLSYFSPAK